MKILSYLCHRMLYPYDMCFLYLDCMMGKSLDKLQKDNPLKSEFKNAEEKVKSRNPESISNYTKRTVGGLYCLSLGAFLAVKYYKFWKTHLVGVPFWLIFAVAMIAIYIPLLKSVNDKDQTAEFYRQISMKQWWDRVIWDVVALGTPWFLLYAAFHVL